MWNVMLICALVVTFFAVVATGPAGAEWLEQVRERRRERRALLGASARVVYLPSSACRSPLEHPTWPETLDAIE